MLGIIRVLTSNDQQVLHEHSRLMEKSHGIVSHTECIDDQPDGVYDDESEAQAIPKIIALAQQLAARGDIDAITISCAADPGLEPARKAIDIPVLGAGECGAHAALTVADRIAVLGIGHDVPPRMRAILGDRFHSYRNSVAHRRTTDLFATDAFESLLAQAQEAEEGGADAVLFACTGFATVGLRTFLAATLSIPVIDLVHAQANAYSLITREQ